MITMLKLATVSALIACLATPNIVQGTECANKLDAESSSGKQLLACILEMQTEINQLQKLLANASAESRNQLIILMTGPELPSTGGNTKSGLCPKKSYMIGARFQSDPGGPHGIVSNIWPVCRQLR